MSPLPSTTTILIIDDLPANLGVIVEHLESVGYRVVVAQEGEEGVRRAEFVRPDLILLDVLMPRMDGFETCCRLKANAKTQDIPVIFMTALTDAADKVKAFAAGGVDYVTKPFQHEEVMARVNTHLSLRAMQQLLEARNQQLQQQANERQQHQAELEYRATHDSLSGLPNRTLFRDRLIHAIRQASRQSTRLAVMFIDLDRFKLINDTLGHSAGDELLQATARRLEQCVREADTLARLGGDEFVLLLENPAGESELAQLAQRVAQVLAVPFMLAGQEHRVTGSIGISIYPQDGEDAEVLLKHADIAMYRAKESGRNAFYFYTQQMQERLNERIGLERQLRQALEREEFVLHFQPQVDLHSGRVSGLEALIRWQSPERGCLPPAHFVPVAEESRLILEIGEWVLQSVCQQVKSWLALNLPVVPVAINLACAQFLDQHFDQRVLRALGDHQLEARYLELELTETSSMSRPEAAIAMMRRLKDIGVSLAIDDFGIGYSNLGYLKRFAVDKLKIDRSFVNGVTSSPEDRSIVVAVIRLAHCLGLKVVAEGVETEGQLRMLAQEGCDAIQGFCFQAPVPAADVVDLLRRQPRLETGRLTRTSCRRTVLLVEHDPGVVDGIKRLLHGREFELLSVAGAKEACEVLAREEVGVVISDYRLAGEDGISFLARIKRLYPRTLRVLMTGYINSAALESAINQAEAFRFIAKPWTPAEVIETLREAFQRYEERSPS